jgi:predicted ATPase/DNA-binding SARP family transcriptional activator
MSSITIALFGPIQIHRQHGSSVTLAYDKVRALLAYLVVESDRPHRRETLAELLWPDRDERSARHSLSQALFSLRQSLGDQSADAPLLGLTRDSVYVDTSSRHELDVTTFSTLLEEVDGHDCQHAPHPGTARSATHPHPCRACARKLQQALALYRGAFLEQIAVSDSVMFDDWLRVTREHYQQRAIELLERAIAYSEWRGDRAQALAQIERLIALDPWREDAYRRGMRLLSADGQRTAALDLYARCRTVLASQLDIVPEQETTALYEAIRAGHIVARSSTSATPRAGNLPTYPEPFIGRERELRELGALLDDDGSRLITLVGPGGIGKTRLAVQAATNASATFAHGCWFVSLAGLSDHRHVPQAIAEATGTSLDGRAAADEQLLWALRDREMLLVLDNAEHLLEIAGFLLRILEQAPHVHLLVTSRERLQVRAEWVVTLDGLSLPQDSHPASLAASTAAQLFQVSAMRAAPGYHLQPDDRAAIVDICHLLEGLPLGIELAASWMPLLHCQEIAAEIRAGLDFLATSMRDVPERHRSLRAVFQQSWQRLTPPERRAFRRLSVFHGGFGRAAAETITGTALPILSRLATQSLVRHDGNGRYALHELLRQFAAEHLAHAPAEAFALRDSHCTWYMAFLAQRETRLRGAEQTRALAEISAEYANIRVAWQWAVEHQRLDAIASAIHTFWLYSEIRGHFHEFHAFITTLEALIEQLDASAIQNPTRSPEHAVVLGRALNFTGAAFIRLGGPERWRERINRALELFAALDAARDMGLAYNFRAIIALAAGDDEGAERDLRASIACFETARDTWGTGYSRNDLGATLLQRGRTEEARQLAEESLRSFREIGDRRGMAYALHNLGVIALMHAQLDAARDYHAEALTLRREIDYRWGIATSHIELGVVATRRGAFSEARSHLVEGLQVAVEARLQPAVLHALLELAALLAEERQLDSARGLLLAILQHPDCDAQLAQRAAQLQRKQYDAIPIETNAMLRDSTSIDDYVSSFLAHDKLLSSR